MYIRVSNPKFLELGDSGRPAAGYLVYTLVAGTVDTLATTYSDKDFLSANPNPVVLDARGEADIFTNIALKLVYTGPTGTLASPIWTEDYVTGQQETVSDKGNGIGIGNNNYTVDIVPAYTSIPDGLSLVMIPDTTNLGTLVIPIGQTVPTVFTGAGINDGIFSGEYLGTIAGAIFAVTIDSANIPDAIAAPTLAENAAAGSVTAGGHGVKLVAVTDSGKTAMGNVSITIDAAGGKKLDVSGIPAIGGGITGYEVHMNKSAGAIWYFVALVTTTTYTIDVSDAELTEEGPTANTTIDTFSWQIDGGAITAGVPITGIAQYLSDGIYITFAGLLGHTVGDAWALEVMTPARLNFCGLGNDLIYKSSGGVLEVLDAADIIAGYPAHLDRSLSQSCWILINPSLPVLESIIPLRQRKNVSANYTIDPALDQGTELNAIAALTFTLPDCPEAVGHFFYLRNGSTGAVIVDAGTYVIKGISDASTIELAQTQVIQIVTDGTDWHILTNTEAIPVGAIQLYGGTTAPAGFLLCNGAAISRTTYAGLFAVIGVAFGGGDGSTTFNVPGTAAKLIMGVASAIGTSATFPTGAGDPLGYIELYLIIKY